MPFRRITTPEQLEAEFDAFRLSDGTDLSAQLIRYFFVINAGLALWWASDALAPLVSAAIFSLASFIYWIFLRSHKGPTKGRHIVICCLFSTVMVICYSMMMLFVCLVADGQLMPVAICGVLGVALHSLARSQDFSMSVMFDFLLAMSSAALVFGCVTMRAESPAAQITIALASLLSMAYYAASLRQIILERKALLEKNEAEAKAQKMQALGQLTSGIAHDFNNLMTVMRGNIDLALLQIKVDETRQLLYDARTAVERGADLVHQLLVFSHKSKMKVSEIDLDDLVAGLDRLLTRTMPSNISVMVSTQHKGIPVRGDSALLESAILNLAINARDAIGPQAGRIYIDTGLDPEGEGVVLTVTDDGPGMEPRVLERVFEPFYTTKSVGKGFGLGLPMVKGIIEQMGGKIELRSTAGAGVVVIIMLPTATPTDYTAPTVASVTPPPAVH